MAKFIPLSQGLQAIVDDSDYDRVMKFRWYADVGKWATYAKCDRTDRGRIRLHVYIMQPPEGMVVHHKDKNGLNCQRDNLVVTDQMTNARFTALRSIKTGSKYRGVYKKGNRYIAEFWSVYKKHYLGSFETDWEAALAYNRFGVEYLGEGNFELNIIDI